MADLKDIMAFLCQNYPYKDELSDARLTKMVYLADWKSALNRGCQLTEITWKFNHYGPYVEDVRKAAQEDEHFEIETTNNMFGGYKKLITLKKEFPSSLSEEETKILMHVIETTFRLTWDGFIKLVYSTLPVVVSERGSNLNLVETARKYKTV